MAEVAGLKDKAKKLKEALGIIGGSTNFRDYVFVASVTYDLEEEEYSEFIINCVHLGDDEVAIRLDINQCFCTQEDLRYLKFIKRKGYYGSEYPSIMVGSRCVDHFIREGGKGTKKICKVCMDPFELRQSGDLCRSCQAYNNGGYILRFGEKFKGKTFRELYDSSPSYCDWVLDNHKLGAKWDNFKDYIKVRQVQDITPLDQSEISIKLGRKPPPTLEQIKKVGLVKEKYDPYMVPLIL